nr:hypothetical protein [Tanacetum cinerariifolium]
MDHNIDFSGFDQIQTPQYPDVHENPLKNDEFEAFMKDDLLNQMRNFIQNFQSGPPGEDKEHEVTTNTELLSTEDIYPLVIQEPPRESNICQLIEECCLEVPEQQKQNMEKTMLDLVKICHHKQFLCIHDDVDNLIESALDSKLLSINSINSQRLDKKEQEVKIVEELPAERRNQDKRECDELVCDNHSDTFSDSKIDDDISVYDDDFEDIEYVEASLLDPEIFSIEEENGVEEENVVQQEEEEVDLEDIS